MDVYTIRKELETKSIYDIDLRVTFYARVSSEKDEQLNSLSNQISYYQTLIEKNPHWTYVNGYIDEGISGMSTLKRDNFHQMIKDAEEDKFDLIITKEISRFARNTLDSITYTRKLLSAGVGVFFQNDNINTLFNDSELRLAIMSSIAQDELRKMSERIKFGHKESIKKNTVLGNSRIFGYAKENKRLVIDEAEAAMVKDIFELYATGTYSLKQLENILWDKGYKNRNGNKIAHNTLSNIISNPKYKGYYVGHKVEIVDMFTKKQKFLPPEEWVMFKDESGDIVPAIVSEELWEQANNVLQKRSNDVKLRQNKYNHNNILTGKMYCACCGVSYYRRDTRNPNFPQENNSKWVCSGKIKNGAESCPSFTIYEKELVPILYELFKQSKEDIAKTCEQYIALFNKSNSASNITSKIEKLKNQIEKERDKKSKLLTYNVDGKITDDQFIEMLNGCENKIKEKEKNIEELKSQIKGNDNLTKYIKRLKDIINSAAENISVEMIDKAFIDKFIDKIIVTPTDKNSVKLDVKILTGQVVESSLKRHTGQMVNNICPVRHFQYERKCRREVGHKQIFTYDIAFCIL